MSGQLDPFTTLVREDGALEPDRSSVEQRLDGMRSMYQDVPPGMEDRVIYRVHHMPVPRTGSEIQCSTTVLEAGTVGDEYFMTKGHFHAIRDRSEVYIGLAGEGLIILATESGEHRVEPMRRDTIVYVPGGWAHRSVNTGDEPLIFFAAYVGDAGHDYEAVATRGLPVIAVRSEDGPRILANPGYMRPSR